MAFLFFGLFTKVCRSLNSVPEILTTETVWRLTETKCCFYVLAEDDCHIQKHLLCITNVFESRMYRGVARTEVIKYRLN